MTRKFATDQVTFLEGYLPLYEKALREPRKRGTMREFTESCVTAFTGQFGMPEFVESDAKLRQIIYNWFRNATSPKGVELRKAKNDRTPGYTSPHSNGASPLNEQEPPHSHLGPSHGPSTTPGPAPPPSAGPSTSTSTPAPPAGPPPAPADPHEPELTALTHIRSLILNPSCHPSALSSSLHTYTLIPAVAASRTPLARIAHVFLDAAATLPHPFLITALTGRFVAAAAHLPPTLVHAGETGLAAGLKALALALRSRARWQPTPGPPEEERARRAQHVLAAQIHGAFLQWKARPDSVLAEAVGRPAPPLDPALASEPPPPERRPQIGELLDARDLAFADLIVDDSVWGEDPVEWFAGACLLTGMTRACAELEVAPASLASIPPPENWKERCAELATHFEARSREAAAMPQDEDTRGFLHIMDEELRATRQILQPLLARS